MGKKSDEIKEWIVSYITNVLSIPKDSFSTEDQFIDCGMDSVEITIMAGMVEEQYNIEINLADIVESQNTELLADFIESKLLEDNVNE